jgi:hypothetical protein
MSRSTHAPAGRPAGRPAGGSRRLASLLLLLLIAGLSTGTVVADPPPSAQRLSPADAAAAGVGVALHLHAVAGAALLEVGLDARAGLRLLAVAPDGSQAALAGPPDAAGWLLIAAADGSQLRVALPGVSGAAFDRGGGGLAAIDARGGLWLVDPISGAARRVADGPFAGTPLFGADGSIVALAVGSTEAPYPSRAVRVDLAGGTLQPLSDDDLVYAAWQLADGGVALLAHEPAGNRLKLATDGRSRLLADLGMGAIAASVSTDGSLIAFQRGRQGIFVTTGRGPARRVADGSAPELSADGRWLLVHRDEVTDLLDLSTGTLVATYDGAAAFTACAGECLP